MLNRFHFAVSGSRLARVSTLGYVVFSILPRSLQRIFNLSGIFCREAGLHLDDVVQVHLSAVTRTTERNDCSRHRLISWGKKPRGTYVQKGCLNGRIGADRSVVKCVPATQASVPVEIGSVLNTLKGVAVSVIDGPSDG